MRSVLEAYSQCFCNPLPWNSHGHNAFHSFVLEHAALGTPSSHPPNRGCEVSCKIYAAGKVTAEKNEESYRMMLYCSHPK